MAIKIARRKLKGPHTLDPVRRGPWSLKFWRWGWFVGWGLTALLAQLARPYPAIKSIKVC